MFITHACQAFLSFIERKEVKPQRNDIPGDIHTILKKDNKLWRSDKTKEKCLDFRDLGG